MKSTKDLNKIIKQAYAIFANTYCGNMYSDSDWSNVYKVVQSLEFIPGVENVNMSAGVYYNYFQFDGDKTPYRLYTIDIDTNYGKLAGEIQCCAGGTINDPFKQYDMILTLWIDKSMNESKLNKKIINESFNIQQVVAELKNASNFNDIKRIVKKNVKGGILAGTILAMVLVNFSLSNDQSKELKQLAYQSEIEYIDTTESIEEYAEPEPIWDLLTNDVHATVYNATPSQCNNDVRHTASGFALDLNSPEDHKVIAMERTMMAKYGLKYGDLVMIKGTGLRDGVYQIQDTMNKRFKGQHKIDILINKTSKIGKWDDIEIYKLSNPEEVYDTLKADMSPAKNQASIDRRQGNSISESFSSRLIKFDDDDEDFSFSKSKKTSEEINNDVLHNTLQIIMKQTLVNGTSTDYDMYVVEHNEDDTVGTEIIKYYDIYDINAEGGMIIPPADVIPGNGVRAQRKREKDLIQRTSTKNNKSFTRILVNKNTRDVHICIHTPFWSCKYLTISKPILDFIDQCILPIKSIGIYSGGISNIKLDENNEPKLSMVTDDVTFFFTKNWKSKSYYLPKYVKPNDKFNEDVVLSDELVNKFPTKISSAWGGDKDKRINIYTAMCKSIKSYIKIVKAFVSAGYTIADEFNNIYTSENVEQYEGSLAELTSDEAIQEKQDKIEQFLQNLLGYDILQKFDTVNNNKQTKHLYLRQFYKQNRKQKNIYKKLSGPVVIQFLKDNGINIDEIIKESQAKYLDSTSECVKYVNQQIGNGFNRYTMSSDSIQQYINDITDYLPTYDYIQNNNYTIFNREYHNYDTFTYCYDEDAFNENMQFIMLQRFFYKFNRKTEIENPNGWNDKNRSNVNSVISKVAEEGYMGGYTTRWMDFCDSSLALDDHSDLMFLFYALGYALINSYSQEHFGISQKSLNELENANVEPVMNNIDFSAIIKCLSTVLDDMAK